jgi:predicted transposase YbfD/YdcC
MLEFQEGCERLQNILVMVSWFSQETNLVIKSESFASKLSSEYYISSEKLNAEIFAERIKGHWLTENQVHWVKDVNFNEEKILAIT